MLTAAAAATGLGCWNGTVCQLRQAAIATRQG